MIFFRWDHDNPTETNAVNLPKNLLPFRWETHLHRDTYEFLLRQPIGTNKRARALADIVAGMLAQLVDFNVIGPDVVKTALSTCNDLVLNEGFSDWDESGLSDVASVAPNVILVPGCQGLSNLESRVSGAIYVWNGIQSVVHKAIFAGSRPPGKSRHRILNEGNKAKSIFVAMMKDQRDTKPPNAWMRQLAVVEHRSTNTRQNLRNAFAMEGLPTEPFNLFVVSNNFHLPKIARILREDQHKDLPFIRNIVLVGAEDVGPKAPLLADAAYAKQVFYVLYSELLPYLQAEARRPNPGER